MPPASLEKERRRVRFDGEEVPVAAALTRLAYPANLAGLPALTFPLYQKNNLPTGLQVLVPRGRESALLAFADLLEKLGLGFRKPSFAS